MSGQERDEPEVITEDVAAVEAAAEEREQPTAEPKAEAEAAQLAEEPSEAPAQEAVVEEAAEEAAPPEEVSPEERLQALEAELEAARAQAEEYLDQWRRTAAEFANYRKRLEREQAEFIKQANAALIAKLLPVLDDFDLAFEHLPEEVAESAWVEGFALIRRKLHAILEQEGVTPIEAVGQPFDPTLHEAVSHEESEEVESGHVIAEVRKGYRLGDRVLRPALVRVAR